ncbi:MAG: tetratricopeptide repeat protein [Deltaproteobacteria bacterium]|jgi:adenylate cyclase|nr:tetratricopeptide repeat protein [Deltaproteobacteria bacterium]
MIGQTYNRKIAAILSADVKDYSRLMGENEEATVLTLLEHQRVMNDLVNRHRGRVVDSPGDNLLAEFGSVVDALRCAWDIQREIKTKNDRLPEDRRMKLRIGVNLGDVIAEQDRLYGDGVNIAARLEGLAEAGGICISGTAYDQVKNKLPYRFKYLGDHDVKNIKDPVRVYQAIISFEDAGNLTKPHTIESKRMTRLALSIGLFGVIGVFLITGWYYFLNPTRQQAPTKAAEKTLDQGPDIPSIAVLPFKNLSGDSEQEYFSDGISNDIITDLAKFRELLVIASNTTFIYKNKPVNVQEIGRELDVRYVVEGSVQRAGDKLRINAQLVDTAGGHHLWAERYDRDLKDLFIVQNEIVQTIVAKLAVKVKSAEQARTKHKDPKSFKAYDYLLRGQGLFARRSRSANNEASQMFAKAIELDPQYGAAYAGLGWTHFRNVSDGWTEFIDQALQQAVDLARKALELDDAMASAYNLLGSAHIFQAQYELAINELHRAIKLNPNNSESHALLGWVLLWSGQTDEAIQALEKTIRLDVRSKQVVFLFHLGLAYYLEGQYQKAVAVLEEGVVQDPDYIGYHIGLAATYAQLGRTADAEREAANTLQRNPFFEVGFYGTAFRNPDDREKIRAGLRKAGLK